VEKEYLKFLAKQLMFELNEEELKMMEADFITLNKQFALLEEIDTSNIAALVFPYEEETTYLRPDLVSDNMESGELLCNAVEVSEGLLIVPKVANR